MRSTKQEPNGNVKANKAVSIPSTSKDLDPSLVCPSVLAHNYAKCSAYKCEFPGLLQNGSGSKYHVYSTSEKKVNTGFSSNFP